MKPRIQILGSTGQLGVELVKALSPEADVFAFSRRDVDLTDAEALRSVVHSVHPQLIINAAAYTAVDRAESEPALAHAVNAVAPRILAEEALALNAWLIHYSTDYVFDGSGHAPWKETDTPRPLNVYGRTKLDGELAIAESGCLHLIFRTSWVYAAHGGNFLRTMLRMGGQRPRLTIVDDQIGAPTTAGELARGTRHVLRRLESDQPVPEPGVYHMTCAGSTSWFGFAQAIFARFAGQVATPQLIPISTEQYPTPAVRPHNSVLNCDKLEHAFGLRLAPWQEALAQVAAELKTEGL
jgi:dTDP-4-dehydrorhamnose reductase